MQGTYIMKRKEPQAVGLAQHHHYNLFVRPTVLHDPQHYLAFEWLHRDQEEH